MSATRQYVEWSTTDHIATVRLTRADKLNALTLQTLDELIQVGREIRVDRSVRAVILVGDGDAFCAGLDFATVMKTPQKLAIGLIPRPWRGTNTFQEACWVWRRLPVPVIAAVHGHCLGGGLQLALAADFRITTPDAQWSVLEGKWGLIPDMTGVQALVRTRRHRDRKTTDHDRGVRHRGPGPRVGPGRRCGSQARPGRASIWHMP
ncbi:MAG: enoyl-CoA hydratase-related protein [Marmoricola sp.]